MLQRYKHTDRKHIRISSGLGVQLVDVCADADVVIVDEVSISNLSRLRQASVRASLTSDLPLHCADPRAGISVRQRLRSGLAMRFSVGEQVEALATYHRQ